MDAGNYFKPLGPGSDLVNQLMLESLHTLPIQVMNLAPEDLFMWKELAQKSLKTKIISTNLVPRSKSLSGPATHALVQIPGSGRGLNQDLRVGFLGLSSPDLVKPNSGFSALDPEESVARVKAEILSKVDLLIVLADLPRAVATRLALKHPEIHAIILAEKQFVFHKPEQINNALIVSSIERGRYLGQLELDFDGGPKTKVFKADFIELKTGVPEDPTLLRRQGEISARLPANAF